ncbi:MAG: hypothetical protein JXX14_22055 [Deltaproteobacteria bacterium]|nr:hypothetical protein [Deltaproteobacteria bacterium]
MPAAAKWEYATKAGTSEHTDNGDVHYLPLGSCEEEPARKDNAWQCNNSEDELHFVRQKQPNPWGLYDICMNGLIFGLTASH